MGGNICKRSNSQGINLQYIKSAYVAQYQENKQPNQKLAEDLERYFSKEDIQMANKHRKDA